MYGAEVIGEGGAFYHEVEFGVQVGRARVEVEGADEDAFPVDGEGLGVERAACAAPTRPGAAERGDVALGTVPLRRPAQLEEPDSGAEQRPSPFRVARVDDGDVRRLHRIGQDQHLDAVARHAGKGVDARRGGNETGRHEP